VFGPFAVIHRRARVEEDVDGRLAIFLVLFDVQFLGPGVELPIDPSRFVTRRVPSVIREGEPFPDGRGVAFAPSAGVRLRESAPKTVEFGEKVRITVI
jgi:hypothetical protein